MYGRHRSTVDIIANQLEQQSYDPFQRDQKPLIDFCTNEWKNDPIYRAARGLSADDDSDDFYEESLNICQHAWKILKAPRIRRLLLTTTVSILLFCLVWFTFLGRILQEERAVWKTLSSKQIPEGGIWGSNVKVKFAGMRQIGSISPHYLPSTGESQNPEVVTGRRLIFVGDIHGCMDEFKTLLEKVNYNSSSDHIVTTGDVINKGPKSLEVVDFLRGQNASCVRGNHDDRILLLAHSLGLSTLRTGVDGANGAEGSTVSAKTLRERELAALLNKNHIKYLSECPLILRAGQTPRYGNMVVTHAGLTPQLALEKQDPVAVMTMRILDLETHTPSEDHKRTGYVPWAELWNSFQRASKTHEQLPWNKNKADTPFEHTTVIYGHDSKKGLQMKRWSKGLDSGCFKGGKLTAWVLSDGGKEELVQVDCKDYTKSDK